MVILVSPGRPATAEELTQAKEEFIDYVKVVLDLSLGHYTLGGQLHADGEKLLLANGSRQEDLWGGGIDLPTGEVDCVALINLRSSNSSQEILDTNLRQKFFDLVKSYFGRATK